MRVLPGTSGFSYKSWKGVFYPEDLPQKQWLDYYSRRLPSVEINNTFYRLPKAEVLQQWAAATPEDFSFVIKASRRITHMGRLKGVEDPLGFLLRGVEQLEQRLGALLFQLPPNMAADVDRLRAFVALLPRGVRAAFEFRHPSWFDEAVYDCLRERDLALCLADQGDGPNVAGVATATWGYLRLRGEAYSEEQLAEWRTWVLAQGWSQAFVFFKHEEAGVGPRLAQRFAELCDEEPSAPSATP